MEDTDTIQEDEIFVRNLTIIKAAIYSFFFILGVFGNILVIRATTKFASLRRPTNILICNLCVCDIIIMLIGIPMFITGKNALAGVFGAVACMGIDAVLVAVISATVFTLVTIAIERFDVIVNSVHTKLSMTTKKAVCIVASIDVVSVLLAVPLLFSKFKRDDGTIRCERDWSEMTRMVYVSTLFLLQYIIPLFVMTLLYTVCWHKIRLKNNKTIKLSIINRTSVRERSKSAILADDSVAKTLEDISDITNRFLSGSNNHLSSSANGHRIRRSFSADSVYILPQGKDNSDIRDKHRRSATFDLISKETNRIYHSSSGSFGESPKPPDKCSALMASSTSLRGSMQKFQQSVTSLLIGTDTNIDSHTAFTVKRIKQTLQTLKVFSCILVIFAICMLPHHVADLMDATGYQDNNKKTPLFSFLHLFIYLNAAINPWIYAGMNKSYRLAYRGIFGKKNHLAFLLRKNLFRTPSGRLVLHKRNERSHTACLSKILIQLCGRFLNYESPDEAEEERLAAFRERGDTIKSMNNSQFCTRTYTSESGKDGRKDSKSSKTSRKTSTTVSEYEIPVLAPIIIITCYDDEVAAQKQFEDEDFLEIEI